MRKRLAERNLRQQDLVEHLKKEGYTVEKALISQMMHGNSIGKRMREIREINRFLGIPEAQEGADGTEEKNGI